MNTKVKYKTKQREQLLRYLETVPGVHITVHDVCRHFAEAGVQIGQTTVYRQLERMVDEGLVNKYVIDGTSSACFEYSPEESAAGGLQPEVCFHCKCERCGTLIHMHCEELAGIQQHLLEHHHFRLNPMRTVFYGVCDACAAKEVQEAPGGDRP